MSTLKTLTIVALAFVLSACTSTAPKQAQKTAIEPLPACEPQQNNSLANLAPKPADTHVYLAFAEQFANASPEAQKLSLANTQQMLTANPNDLLQRFKLTMIYSLPSSNLQDFAKAQNLLQGILQENNLTNAQIAFAHLLFDHLTAISKADKNSRSDEKRIEGILQKNESLQNKLETTQQKLTSTQQKLDITQQKLDAAQQKIDELKNIEKSMGQREVSPKK